jgi:hypothetical protein
MSMPERMLIRSISGKWVKIPPNSRPWDWRCFRLSLPFLSISGLIELFWIMLDKGILYNEVKVGSGCRPVCKVVGLSSAYPHLILGLSSAYPSKWPSLSLALTAIYPWQTIPESRKTWKRFINIVWCELSIVYLKMCVLRCFIYSQFSGLIDLESEALTKGGMFSGWQVRNKNSHECTNEWRMEGMGNLISQHVWPSIL